MARFVFRLEPVLAHRRRLETEQQLVLAAAVQRLRDAEWLRDDYRNRRDALRARIVDAHHEMDADELRATYAHCEYLDRAIIAQDRVVLEVRRAADAERVVLIAKVKEKKILETLRERRRAAFVQAAAAAEQGQIDEINARRFDRATTEGTPS